MEKQSADEALVVQNRKYGDGMGGGGVYRVAADEGASKAALQPTCPFQALPCHNNEMIYGLCPSYGKFLWHGYCELIQYRGCLP